MPFSSAIEEGSLSICINVINITPLLYKVVNYTIMTISASIEEWRLVQ